MTGRAHFAELTEGNWKLWRLFDLLKCAGERGISKLEIQEWFRARGRPIFDIPTHISAVRAGAARYGWTVPRPTYAGRTENGQRIMRYRAVRLGQGDLLEGVA